MLEQLMQEIAKLQEAQALLEKVYAEIGPYKDGKVSEKTWTEVLRHFKFDDSE